MSSRGLRGEATPPSDKSITHRLIMFSGLAEGETAMRFFEIGRDNLSTLRIMKQLGVSSSGMFSPSMYALGQEEGISDLALVQDEESLLKIVGRGVSSITKSTTELYCGNSGTTARLLTGVLAGCGFSSQLAGDESLTKRPFQRVIDPLTLMGATFSQRALPFTISGGKLRGIRYESPHASAQVKSALLLAGLQTKEEVVVSQPAGSRNHTELLLKEMGCDLTTSFVDDREIVTLPANGNRTLKALGEVTIPGDFSAASFLIIAALLLPKSEILVKNVGFNSTRNGLFGILRRMGAALEVVNQRSIGGESVVDLHVRASELSGTTISPKEVALSIDEIPILSVAASFAKGETSIAGVNELRVKESNRLSGIITLLTQNGFFAAEEGDGLRIGGISTHNKRVVLRDSNVAHFLSSGDHRMIMCGAVMDLCINKGFRLVELSTVETSFPNFVKCFQALT